MIQFELDDRKATANRRKHGVSFHEAAAVFGDPLAITSEGPDGRRRSGVIVSKVTSIGGQTVSIAGGIRYWIDSPESGPKGWGGRLVFTLLFPR